MVADGPVSLDGATLERFTSSYEQHRKRHEVLLSDIVAYAKKSPLYANISVSGSSLDDLASIPLTFYEDIAKCIESEGLEKVLLGKVEQSFRTSGSTGSPKSFFYGINDIERISSEYMTAANLVGITSKHRLWNLGGPLPDVSGYIMNTMGKDMGMEDLIPTLLHDDKDLVKALRRISKEEKVDVMVSTALVFYLIGRMSREPDYLRNMVEDKARRSFGLPGPLAKLAAMFYLRGVDMHALRKITGELKMGISFAEPLSPYLEDLKRSYPKLQIYDVYGSTENPIMAAQLDPTVNGLCMIISSIIPEIAPIEDVRKAKSDPTYRVRSTPWYQWSSGMVGELIITRPGQCLPLLRYPTGDVIEVLEPAHSINAMLDGKEFSFSLPLIRIMGRSVDALDFEAQDECGNFFGVKVYTRQINEALHRSGNVRWWEIFKIKGAPARLIILVIPESDPSDRSRFKHEIFQRLTHEDPDIPQSFLIANDLGMLDVIVLPSDAFQSVQAEIDRRVKEGRSYGQLKPKRIHVMSNEEEYEKAMTDRYSHWLPDKAK
ncbi:MAG: GH3 auxin-responsive promoter [Methanomassiliicoccales archaeon PtaU1.Bin124]|nr:MAG: GH3 auxin-responsive promoter [Methanomassiliicoccales archaeon PtaU1.Bin124]